MAATLSSLVTVFLDKLSTLIQEEVSMLSEVKSELEGLERTIKEIKCVLADAESRAFYSEAIRLWLKELKEVMYDAEDIIDDCKVAGEITASGQPEVPSSSVRPVRTALSSSLSFLNKVMFTHKIGKRLKRVNSRLEEISNERSQFQLIPNVEENTRTRLISHHASSLVETDIAGVAIQLDSSKLIKILVEGGNRLDVIAITGMGGIGKTTLAQLIYNDQLIKANFQMKMWVCVSKEFTEIKLLREIITWAGGNPGDGYTKGRLELMLRSLTQGKKFFLVLDDVWTADVWEDVLQNPLQGAAAGSKVLITSRFETLVRQLGVLHLHRVGRMTVADGWSLLCKKVSMNGEEGDMESLRDLGVKIVERCGGLPLAIKVVGGVLRGRGKNREDWEEVLHSRTWSSSIFPEDMKDMVMEALHLSYEDLPPPLKQCFLYLSLFPEDHVFKCPSVVRQWIAEGFVKTTEGNALTLEGVGKEYFRELVDRSLLQPEFAAVEGTQCRMHDLLRSLAQFLAEDENFFGDTSKLKDESPKLRRLSIADDDATIDIDALKTKECLRTLFLFRNPHAGLALRQDVLETLGHLRVLDLREAHIEELPYSIAKLRHLRHLDVSGTGIRKLPESIADLGSLQFLLLSNCRNICALPNGITKLKNLRSLELHNGTEVDQMPKGIGGMSQLRNLKDFVVDSHEGALEELGPLPNIYLLGISRLERVSDQAQARSAALDNKPLIYLGLGCTLSSTESCHEEMKRRMVDVFDGLRPPPSLQVLNIAGYMGHTLPQWMWPSTASSVSSLHNLTLLVLSFCMYFSQLPPLGLLPHLKNLWIQGAFAVITLFNPEPSNPTFPTMLLPSSSTHHDATATDATATGATVLFPRLEMLSLLDMPNLEKIWDCKRDGSGESPAAFPRLKYLYIEDCPKLRHLPNFSFSGQLKFLHIEGSPALMEVGSLRVPESFTVHDGISDGLPPWLGQVSVDPGDVASFLLLKVRSCLLKRMLRQKEENPDNPDGDWHIIKRFPRVYAKATDDESAFFSYVKNPLVFTTNVQVTCTSASEGRESKRDDGVE